MANERFTTWREGLVQRGSIAPLNMGASQEEVAAVFGAPDDVSAVKKKGRPIIFKYADIEFHFDHLDSHRLFLVHSDQAGVSIR